MESREAILKRLTESHAKCEVKYNMTEPAILQAMQEYADLVTESQRVDIEGLRNQLKKVHDTKTELVNKVIELQAEIQDYKDNERNAPAS